MNEQPRRTVVLLATGLFVDSSTVEAGGLAANSEEVLRHDLDVSQMDDAAWDHLLGELLAADVVITL